MKEIYKNLYVGFEYDYEINPRSFDDWFVVHACKEPFNGNTLTKNELDISMKLLIELCR